MLVSTNTISHSRATCLDMSAVNLYRQHWHTLVIQYNNYVSNFVDKQVFVSIHWETLTHNKQISSDVACIYNKNKIKFLNFELFLRRWYVCLLRYLRPQACTCYYNKVHCCTCRWIRCQICWHLSVTVLPSRAKIQRMHFNIWWRTRCSIRGIWVNRLTHITIWSTGRYTHLEYC